MRSNDRRSTREIARVGKGRAPLPRLIPPAKHWPFASRSLRIVARSGSPLPRDRPTRQNLQDSTWSCTPSSYLELALGAAVKPVRGLTPPEKSQKAQKRITANPGNAH